jgi:hypothetical protein
VSNAYRDSAHAAQANYDRLEREAARTLFDLWINETFELQVGGHTYQVQVDCHVRKTGEHGDLEIENETFRYERIHVALPLFANPLELVEQNLREDHSILWRLIEANVDLKVLEFAGRSQIEAWEAA